MTIINLLYATLPLLFSLILIAKTGSVYKPMLYSAFLGLAQYGLKIGLETIFSTSKPFSGFLLLTVANRSAVQATVAGFQLMKSTLMDKAPIVVAVFVLFIMVKLIIKSRALVYINMAADRFVKSRIHFLTVFLGLSVLFSIDDYLCCVGIAAVVAGIAERQSVSRERTAYMISQLSVAFCTLLPYSSWMPVVRSAVGAAVPLQAVTLLNLAAFYGVFIVIADVLSDSETQKNNQKTSALPDDFGLIIGVLIATATITAVSLVFTNIFTDGTWSVAVAGTAGCVVLITIGYLFKLVTPPIIKESIFEAFTDAVSLFKMLFFVWITKDICVELLGMSSLLKTVMENGNVPVFLIPAVVFTVSSGFAYMTGTSFGAFSLFIPLALELTENLGTGLRVAAAAAALSGSLQSVNRPGSDVINLTSDILKCDEKKLLELQKRSMFSTIPILFTAFSMIGICASYSTPAMHFVGILPILIYSFFHYLLIKSRKPVDAKEFLRWTIVHENNTTDNYYNKQLYTYHQKSIQLEVLYTPYLIGISHSSKNLSPAN